MKSFDYERDLSLCPGNDMTCGVDGSDECRTGLRAVSPASATKLMGYSVAELIR
ncbi:hypothetical protein [Asaia bogorensis]|uniref:Uncharacterized protein n=1 Tax=Asaia bogorensis NBRC 16594 TaxID=1231624 RepID=A0AAN4R389_9PROT|nr:hypothetical protein [Asaia bogorensis]BAT20377.1 hypothetical protein Asbog_02121 [Asaia bogorensis NBRC 16594]GBQ79537.1 hypothetical protein AA0311_2072 [Asaia bogorensis NBRC 16594]GEL52201.1 hypothetical protein ABO01nite_02080 [Asaia bogorensis NBRC 16594]